MRIEDDFCRGSKLGIKSRLCLTLFGPQWWIRQRHPSVHIWTRIDHLQFNVLPARLDIVQRVLEQRVAVDISVSLCN
jgi:hypothetical protein